MDREYLSNNDQEGVFTPSHDTDQHEVHDHVVETREVPDTAIPEKETHRKDRYYASSIAPAVHRIQPVIAYEDDYVAGGIAQFVYLVAGVLNLLLGIRFLFKLFGAASNGVVQMIYRLTDPMVAPFRGIFQSTNVPQAGVFEVESLLAIATIALLAYFIVAILRLSTRNETI